ncbi:MAG: hypothetical protein L0Z50_12865 [Verrucomicrobiales bacterium]|nr:hypothetical protein [Verrucomicrobiales bacterium]
MMKVITAPDIRLPDLTAEEAAELSRACLADPEHKLMPPVVIWQCGKHWIALDGNHQYRIREANRLKVRYHKVSFETRQEARAYAINAQLARRNLGREQYAYWLAERDRELRRGRYDGRPNKSANFADLSKLAEESGVSERTMDYAAKVADIAAAPVKRGVVSGEFAVSDAAAVAELPKAEQTKIVAKAKREGTTLRQAAQPKQGAVIPWEDWDNQFGKLKRLTDQIARLRPNRTAQNKIHQLLNQAFELKKQWKKTA